MSGNTKNRVYTTIVVIGIAAVFSAGGYFYYLSRITQQELALTQTELSNTKKDLSQLEERATTLSQELETEKYKNSLFGGQINEIFGTVGTLDKLAKTDKELLQKYSKVYFLNEHYAPDELVNIPPDYIYEVGKEAQFHTKAFPYLRGMIIDAQKTGIDLKIVSAYRSFGEQSVLKNGYVVSYGSGANKFSADQGYSEHQLGTTVDFTTSKLGTSFTGFAKTESFGWLRANAHKYGFVLSYPENNSYYQFEPWHWRFVGTSLATMLYEEKQSFYDVLQSKIDAYLVKIFD